MGIFSEYCLRRMGSVLHHWPLTAFPASSGRIAVVAPRNMRFSPASATSIDLHIHETTLWSKYRDRITVFAQDISNPFTDVPVRFWPKNAPTEQIVKTVHDTAPSMIVVHQHQPTAMAMVRRDVPVALVRHNFQKPPRNVFSRLLKGRQFDRLSAIAFVSECCQADFRANWSKVRTPIHVVLNGIDGAQWQSALRKDPLILFVGRMAPEKGALEAAQAMADILSTDEAAGWNGLFIVSTAPEHAAYARVVEAEIERAQGRITLMSDLPHDAVRQWMARTAILLAPTLNREPFGRVAIEGMASGAVLIASARGGFVEIAGDAAVLLENPDTPSIAHALRCLITDGDERARLSVAGRERVIPRYDLANAAATFDALVGSLLPREKP